jgi:hypothetical protein
MRGGVVFETGPARGGVGVGTGVTLGVGSGAADFATAPERDERETRGGENWAALKPIIAASVHQAKTCTFGMTGPFCNRHAGALSAKNRVLPGEGASG